MESTVRIKSSQVYNNFSLIVSMMALCTVLVGCSSTPKSPPPKASKELCSGTKRPYTINGIEYTPQDHYEYDKEGVASWYGPGFHGRPTSCGHTYDMHGYTAAHKTLPIPSVVEVTNKENGKKLKLVVTDRGPFVGDRIIDLSHKAANELGTHAKGLGTVQVKTLPHDSKALAEYLKQFGRYGKDPSGRSWDVVYREEIEGKTAQLIPTTAEIETEMLEQDETPLEMTLESALEQEELEKTTEPSKQPDLALIVSSAPVLQEVNYTVDPKENNEKVDQYIDTIAQSEPTPTKVGQGSSKYKSSDKENTPTHFIDVGSFINKDNAQKLLNPLSRHGKANVVKENAQFYTVRLGPFPNRNLAEQALKAVTKSGQSGVRLVNN